MAKGRFTFGFLIGAMAGLAAKVVYDNREEVYVLVSDKAKEAGEGISDFVGYASERIQSVSEGVQKKATEIISEIKSNIQTEEEDGQGGTDEILTDNELF